MKKINRNWTKGEWIKDYFGTTGHVKAVLEGRKSTPTVALYNIFSRNGGKLGEKYRENEIANAELIADAGTIANKTGLTPSELLKQRDELLAALKLARDEFQGTIEMSDMCTNNPVWKRMLKAINNAQNIKI